MSTAIVTSKAEQCIDQVISSQLLRILKPWLDPQQQMKLRDASRQLRVALLRDQAVIESLQVLVPALEKPWLTTPEAAEMMGFSRPYMTALLDSKDFAGKVHKSTGGHRRVLRSDVQDWMVKHGVNFPLTERDSTSLREPVSSEFFEEDELTPEEEACRMEEIENASKEAMQYRPR